MASAISCGLANRRNAIARRNASLILSGRDCSIGVSVGPGHTQLTLILWRAISRANDLVKPIRPALAAAHTVSPVLPTGPASLATLAILPPPAAVVPRNTP